MRRSERDGARRKNTYVARATINFREERRNRLLQNKISSDYFVLGVYTLFIINVYNGKGG